MKQAPYYFEIKDVITQFVAAFDDIVIKRYNEGRKVEDRIEVRYVYSPKQRVLYDIVNLAKTITIPAVAVSVKSISRDESRVFNKIDGFYYNGTSESLIKSSHLRPPVPINIDVDVSILTRYQTDMDQILSNFVPYSNPYVVIGWKVPDEFGLPTEQEIRSEVLWSGSVSMNYPTDIQGNEKARITADTSFTIKAWLFKEQMNPVGTIYYIENNFRLESNLTTYEDVSGTTYSYPVSTDIYNESETVTFSGSPYITNMYFNGNLVDDNIQLVPGETASIILEGYNFDLLDNVMLSSNNVSLLSGITAVQLNDQSETIITGMLMPSYTVINKNILTFTLPRLYPGRGMPNAQLVFLAYNKAGYYTTTDTYESS